MGNIFKVQSIVQIPFKLDVHKSVSGGSRQNRRRSEIGEVSSSTQLSSEPADL